MDDHVDDRMDDHTDGVAEAAGHGDVGVETQIEINPLVHLIAPVVAVIGTMVVRRVVNSLYERVTGHEPPVPRDPRVPFVRAVMWTAVITTSAAVAEVAIYRAVNRLGAKEG